LILRDVRSSEEAKFIEFIDNPAREYNGYSKVSAERFPCKTLGVAAVLLIISKVLIHCRIRNNFTKQTMKDILKDLTSIEIPTEIGFKVIDFSGKQLGAFGGRQGQRKLADTLEGALPPISPSS